MKKGIVWIVCLIILMGLYTCSCGESNNNTANYSISGVVTSSGVALQGVTMTLSGSSSATVTTDTNGNYAFTDLANGNYTIMPFKATYTFTPENSAQTVKDAIILNVNFSGQSTLAQGLVAYYPFNGNANDASDNGNNGTVSGATLTTDRFGNPNSAYSFDGIDDYIKASANNLPTGERTVSLWFNTPIVNNRPGLIGYGGSNATPPGKSWLMGINMWGNPAFFISCHWENNGHPDWDINLLQFSYLQDPVNTWFHFAVTTNSSGTKLYVNGEEKESNTNFINNTEVAGTDLSIGVVVSPEGIAPYTDANIGYFVGSMDDVRIYNRALSAAEIQALYNLP